jgi:hypothetical protein
MKMSKFPYPNHYKMKQNRLLKIQQTKGICEGCGKDGMYIHHLDMGTTNHDIENLVVLCKNCHCLIHSEHREGKWFGVSQYQNQAINMSKYMREYGMNLSKLTYLCRIPQYKVVQMHKEGTLKAFIQDKISPKQNIAI